jgi:hypothetical protein
MSAWLPGAWLAGAWLPGAWLEESAAPPRVEVVRLSSRISTVMQITSGV